MASKLKAKKPKQVTPGHSKGILYGKSGAGKTWFSLNFPVPYFIDTEGGASLTHYLAKLDKAGGGYLGPEDGSCDFDTIIDEIKTLATEKHPYKTLVIDSVTKVYQSTIAEEAERLGSKDAFGASKKPAIAQMRRLVNWITKLDMNVWFLAHEVAEWGLIKGERQQIGTTPDVWDKLIYELDLTLHIENPHKRFRVATVHKTRLLGFPEHDIFILQEGDKDLGYAEFYKRYGRDYIEADPKQLTLCSEEQIKEINGLTEVLRIDEKEIKKILKNGNADEIKELSSEHANKFIIWMRDKIK